jgi:hypothetical protein
LFLCVQKCMFCILTNNRGEHRKGCTHNYLFFMYANYFSCTLLFASCYHHARWMIFRQNLFCSDITLTNRFNQFTTGLMWTFIMSPWHLGLYFLSCTRRNSILLSSNKSGVVTESGVEWRNETSSNEMKWNEQYNNWSTSLVYFFIHVSYYTHFNRVYTPKETKDCLLNSNKGTSNFKSLEVDFCQIINLRVSITLLESKIEFLRVHDKKYNPRCHGDMMNVHISPVVNWLNR